MSAELVQRCIERMGGDTPSLKTGVATVMGAAQGMTMELATDDLVKNALRDYGTEHFEIACHTSLIAAAQDLGDAATVDMCREIVHDEEAMAGFLIQQVPLVTPEMLHDQEAATPSQ
jgi:ferritin-like metal-binding protein YciE